MKEFLARFAADRSGATAIEYGLIATAIAVVLFGAILLVGGRINVHMQTISDALGA